MSYPDENATQKAYMLLQKAAHESIRLIDEGHPRRAQLTLQCALEDADLLLHGEQSATVILR